MVRVIYALHAQKDTGQMNGVLHLWNNAQVRYLNMLQLDNLIGIIGIYWQNITFRQG